MADEYLDKIVKGIDLSFDESHQMMLRVGTGEYSPVHVSSILTGLKIKGETVTEIAGCASAFRELAIEVPHDIEGDVFDCCGTGGDGANTFNISTGAAFITAAMGVPTAKHGNRAVSSKSGSADVLEALGVNIVVSPENAAQCLRTTNFCFLFAPHFHPAMKHVAPVRKELGIPTLFNLLGPLLNPARCTHQIIGTPDCEKAGILAEVGQQIGLHNITSFHNDLKVDELIDGTECCLHRTGKGGTRLQKIWIENGGPVELSDLRGGDSNTNARILMNVFEGEKSPRRNTVVLNAAMGMVELARFNTLEEARHACEDAIDSGAVLGTLKAVIELTSDMN